MACICFAVKARTRHAGTIREQMELVRKLHQINFIYDSSLNVDIPYQGKPLQGLDLRQNLQELFGTTDFKWEIRDKYVLLNKKKKYTVSGYVYQENGEPLINATVKDEASRTGTLSNDYGFFSITLPEGKHVLSFSFIGFGQKKEEILLDKNITRKVYLKEDCSLNEVVVTGDLNSSIYTTQTGKVSLTARELHTEYSLLSSPDVVKTLQNLPGVASGTELVSGLYVHGGNHDENLFLLDGTPLYQVNHLGGLFSAFNTDIIKNIEFYKSGFPARYGGRLSSVVDVRTNDGDMKEYHGNVTMGLLDGRIQCEGPIIKNRTSFNVAMRRSWLDVFSTPVFFFRNKSKKEDQFTARYAFHDINAKTTHAFSDRSKAYISFYSGNDILKVDNKQNFHEYTSGSDEELYRTKFNLQWGNLTTTINWSYRFTPRLFANFTGVYAHNRSLYDYEEEDKFLNTGQVTEVTHIKRRNHSVIDDIGYRMEFDYKPGLRQHVRMGSNYLFHTFRPQSQAVKNIFGNNDKKDTIQHSNSFCYRGHEFTVYAEDDITLGKKWRTNIGVHYTLFKISDKTYHSVEPRVAVRYQWSEHTAIKLSYTEMNQFIHLLSSTYLNLPTDYWVPSTKDIRPMRSRQYAAGVYMRLPHHVRLSLEGFYKTMSRTIEYDGGGRLAPSAGDWEMNVKQGKGKAYGAECELAYLTAGTSVNIAYTLSWSKRKFNEIYQGWYAGKFDNRHKLNIAVRHKFTGRIDAYAAWTFHSGNKMTIPSQYVNAPEIPGIKEKEPAQWIYEKLNNVTLPSYHRMDVGVNFRKTTTRGYERIWNVSIYNAYCRMNALYAKVEKLPEGKFRGKATGVFPIIPSFSYTIKF
jgi:hypothetical protein